jgi:hypothetical protein
LLNHRQIRLALTYGEIALILSADEVPRNIVVLVYVFLLVGAFLNIFGVWHLICRGCIIFMGIILLLLDLCMSLRSSIFFLAIVLLFL